MSSGSNSVRRQMKQRKWFNWINALCFRSVYGNESCAVIEEKSLPPQPMTHSMLSSFSTDRIISKASFEKDVFPHSQLAAQYLWNFFTRYDSSQEEVGHGLCEIGSMEMAERAEKIYAQITDKEQIHFYVKLFAIGRTSMTRESFSDLLLCAHGLSFVAQSMSEATALGNVSTVIGPVDSSGTSSRDLAGDEWIQSAINSCFHTKEEMSVTFICNWMQLHLPRALILFHKYVIYQLAAAKARAQSEANQHRLDLLTTPGISAISHDTMDSKSPDPETANSLVPTDSGTTHTSTSTIQPRVSVSGINPLLLWLLEVSIPHLYTAPLERKPGVLNCPFTKRLTSQELLQQLRNEGTVTEPWSKLYDSTEEGTSVNRFQLHLYHYKGPTLMFIFAENNYTLCVGSDEEWKESSKFWGGEDSFLLQLQPEFRFIERGPKCLYTNFSIRGYPLGIEVTKDTKNVTLEIKPDFQIVSFKGIPCRINRILAFGCGPKEIKNHQAEYKKWENKQCEIQRSVPKRSRSEWSEDTDNYLLGLSGVHTSYVTGTNSEVYTKTDKTCRRIPSGLIRGEVAGI